MKQIIRLIVSGLAIWLVPFVLGFLFYDSSGQLAADIFLFKSIMIISLTLITVLATNRYFKEIESDFVKKGMHAGLIWLVILLTLDVLILIPIAEMSARDYIYQIGLRYSIIPIISISVGFMLNLKIHKH
ncbi:MAG: hypothetical protein ABJG47_11165 [Ekhidna sp.]